MPDSRPVSVEAGVDSLVVVSGLEVSFAGRKALDGVDLVVNPGEIVTLIGPNGAGKTTLVRAVLGQVRPGRGSVRRRPGLTVGYMPQQLTVDPTLPLTVQAFLNLPRRRPKALLETALAEVGMAETLGQPFQDLSGGETQRVLLARALLGQPDLLVLDEPLGGIDFSGQLALFQLIGDMRLRRGCGVLMVSHDLHLVMAGTDSVVCLNHHVCCSGAPESVSHHPEYLALFGPKAAESLAVYTHAHDHQHDPSGAVVSLSKPQGEA